MKWPSTKWLSTFVLLILLGGAPLEGDPLPQDPAVRIGTLSTGVTYYIWPCDASGGCKTDEISLRFVMPIGSAVEEEGEEGLAHFVEHLMFRGSDRFSESDIQHFIEAAGGGIGADANACTSFDTTIYLLNLPSNDWKLVETGLEIFADFAERALIEEDSVEAERGIVLEEWRLGRSADMRLAKDRFFALFDGSPYANRLPIGREEIVRNASTDLIRAFYDKWYRKTPFAIIATGPFDPDQLEEAVRKSFDTPHFPLRDRVYPPLTCPIPHTQQLLFSTDPELPYSLAEISYKKGAKTLQTEEDLKEEVIASLYHALMNRRFVRLQERGFFSCEWVQTGRDCPLACLEIDTFQLSCAPKDTLKALNTFIYEIQRAAEYGFSEREWEDLLADMHVEVRRARDQIRARAPSDLTNQCLAHFISGSTICSPSTIIDAWDRVYPTITRKDLHVFASSLQNPWNAFIHIACPDTVEIDQEMIAELLKRANEQTFLPYDEAPATLPPIDPIPIPIQEETKEQGITTFKLENGMTIHLFPTDDPSSILCQGTALGGLSNLAHEDLPSGKLANALLEDSGVGGLMPSELTSALAGSSIEVYRQITPYSRTLGGGGHPDDIETLFKLIHLAFTAQVNSSDRFKQIQASKVAWSQSPATPYEALHGTVYSLIYSEAPYFQPTDWEQAHFEKSDEIALSAFANPADFSFSFAGPLDIPQMRFLCEKYLASIPIKGPKSPTFIPIETRFPEGITHSEVYRGKEPQSTVEIIFPFDIPNYKPKTIALLSSAASLIRSHVYQILRGALSATYQVDIQYTLIMPDCKGGRLTLSFVCDPEDAHLLAQVALRGLRKLKESGPSHNKTLSARLQCRKALDEAKKENNFWIDELSNWTLCDYPLEEILAIDHRSNVLTQTALHKMICHLLPLDNYLVVTLFPE